MLYKIAHLLRDKMGWLWNLIECLNAMLFSLRYGKKLKSLALLVVNILSCIRECNELKGNTDAEEELVVIDINSKFYYFFKCIN